MPTFFTYTKLIPGIFFFASLTPSFAQNIEKADSINHLLNKKGLSKKMRAKLLCDLAFYHPDLSIALSSAQQSLQIALAIEAPALQAEALEEIGHIERRLGNNSLSLQAALRALQIYDSLGLEERKAASYGQLASNYLREENFSVAVEYLKKIEEIYEHSGDQVRYISTLLNLGEAYRMAGHLDSAVVYFQETLRHNNTLKHETIQGYGLGNLGMAYAAQNKSFEAIMLLTEAVNLLKDLGDTYSTSVYVAELGKIYEHQGDWNAAEEKFREALNMATEAGLKEQIRDFSKLLFDGYEKMQDYQPALIYHKLFKTYQDSLVNKENIQAFERIKAGYEINQRESEIELLNVINTKQRHLSMVLAAGAFLLFFLVYLLYRGIRRIRKANVSLSDQKAVIARREAEKALLLRELNHRVKNNLQMISGLLKLQSHELTGHPAMEAIMAGKDRVEALSLVHRKLYQQGPHTRVQAREYIEELVLGLFHSHGAGFTPDFKIKDISINLDLAIPLALIVNELITNALKHAYIHVKHPELKVSLDIEKDHLCLQVADNGTGFSAGADKKNNSFGLKLIAALTKQLEGAVERLNINGTHWKVNLKIAGN